MSQHLRFAVVVEADWDQSTPSWAAECLRQLTSGPLRLALVLRAPVSRGEMTRIDRLATLGRRPSPTTELPDTGAARHLDVEVDEGRLAPSGQTLDSLRDARLDVIVNLTPLSASAIAASAREGVWEFEHTDGRARSCLAPLLKREAVTHNRLVQVSSDGSRETIHRGTFSTIPFSPALNYDVVASGSVDWIGRAVHEWAVRGEVPKVDDEDTTAAELDSIGVVGYIAARARIGLARIRAHFQAMTQSGQWNVAIVPSPITDLVAEEKSFDQLPIHWLPKPPYGRFYADPFPLIVDGKVHVFVEDLDMNGDARGCIAVFSEDEHGDLIGPRLAIKEPFHLSYPHVFRQGSEIYCVPESFEANAIYLYRATRFPDRWERVATLIEGQGFVDPTVFHHDGLWWIFATTKESGSEAKLHAWWSIDLEGEWTPHTLNPLKTDVRSARPAGPLFQHDGRIYRPAQDCSARYGFAVSLLEVTELSPTHFSEVEVRRFAPKEGSPYPHGLHTLAGSHNITAIDGLRNAFVVREFARQLGARADRLTRRLTQSFVRAPIERGLAVAQRLIRGLLPGGLGAGKQRVQK